MKWPSFFKKPYVARVADAQSQELVAVRNRHAVVSKNLEKTLNDALTVMRRQPK